MGDLRIGVAWIMNAQLAELMEVAQELPENEVAGLVSDAKRRRRHLKAVPPISSSWPPDWFGYGRSGKTDLGENARAYLADGFGES